MRLAGGPQSVTNYLRELGIKEIVVATSEQEMAQGELVQYRNWATPQTLAELLRALQQGRGLTTANRALVLQLLTESQTCQHRLKGRLPAGTAVAHKTGSSGTINGRR